MYNSFIGIMVKLTDIKITEPKIHGVSFALMDSNRNLPMPGQENTVSVTIAPPNMLPKCRPETVIIDPTP